MKTQLWFWKRQDYQRELDSLVLAFSGPKHKLNRAIADHFGVSIVTAALWRRKGAPAPRTVWELRNVEVWYP